MSTDDLIRASAVLVAGLLLAGLMALVVRRFIAGRGNPAVARTAGDAASLTFWVVLAAALAVTIGQLNPGALDRVPASILTYLPRVLAAGLILIAGRALAVVVGRFVMRATERAAVSSAAFEMAVRGTVLGLALVLALSQLGIDTTMLQIVVAGLVAAVALAFGIMTGLGARDVASNIAAGRALRHVIAPGSVLVWEEMRGTVEELGPVLLVVRTEAGVMRFLPHRQVLDSGFSVENGV